jgi:putative peptide zinc metalloprotease protein
MAHRPSPPRDPSPATAVQPAIAEEPDGVVVSHTGAVEALSETGDEQPRSAVDEQPVRRAQRGPAADSGQAATRTYDGPQVDEPSAAPEHDLDPHREIPRLARGIELIGLFEDSGFKEPPYIARRADGQVVQLPQMLFALAQQIDGHSDEGQIAERFSHAIERQVQPADVAMLVDQQLRPLGIVAPPGGEDVALNKIDPLLALKFRAALVPDRAVRSLTTLFKPLFLPPVVLAVVLGLIGVDVWLFFLHGVSQSLRHVIYQPLLMLMLIAGVVVATAFHEIGHATAVRYGGAKPGVMGVGIYLVWPAFYTDITDAYRLGKWGRLRTDLGGVYFNSIFALGTIAVYSATGFEPLLLLIVLQNFAILQQSLPFLRLDGYYVLSDLTGVPDIFLRIRAVLASFLPGREPDARVTELKGWVRGIVSVYVVGVMLFLGATVVMLVINLPRMVSTGYDSVALHYDAIGPAFNHGRTLNGIVNAVEMVFLILPTAGLALTAARVLRRGGNGAAAWSAGRPPRQVALALGGAAAIAVAAFSWWPNGEYRPIQPGEKGTLVGAVHEIAALPSGRPSLTAARAQQLGGAPTERQRRAAAAAATTATAHGRLRSGGRRGAKPVSSQPSSSTSASATQSAQAPPTASTSDSASASVSTSAPASPSALQTQTQTATTATTTAPASAQTSSAP